VGSREVRDVQGAGKGEDGEATARVGHRLEPEPGPALGCQQPRCPGSEVGDPPVVLVRVVDIGVEESFELTPDRRGKRTAVLPIGVDSEASDRMRELRCRAVRALRPALGLLHSREKRGNVGGLRFRPRRRDVDCPVVVGAACERDPAGVHGLDAVPFGELLQVGRGDRRGEPTGELVGLLRAGAVASLPDPEQEHHPLDVRDGEGGAHAIERVGKSMNEATGAEEADELVDGRPPLLEVAVVLLGQVPDEDVERHVVFGEAGRHLDRQERAVQMSDAERPFERVVVGDRHEGHPAPPADGGDALRRRERLAEACATEREVAAVRGEA
jgi:hypothetical protein